MDSAKNKMCSRIKKSAKQYDVQTSRMCKNSIWDLINSTINRRDERDVQTAFFMFIKQSLCLGA